MILQAAIRSWWKKNFPKLFIVLVFFSIVVHFSIVYNFQKTFEFDRMTCPRSN